MHPKAYAGMHSMVLAARKSGLRGVDVTHPLDGLDVGGQNVNGTVHKLFPRVNWTSLDLHDPQSMIVTDARSWTPDRQYDVVICTEVLEHCRWWPLVVRTMWDATADDGFLFITAAAPPRGAHSAQGLDTKPHDEWYDNVNPDELRALVQEVFRPTVVQHSYRPDPGDVYLWAKK